ncbi:MAG TPA: hypothetical protein VG722_00530, partial [Tepidisphaeraceae bacterium]|nr:hypothetical protein [Tepidisphaeraceae bacterium]
LALAEAARTNPDYGICPWRSSIPLLVTLDLPPQKYLSVIQECKEAYHKFEAKDEEELISVIIERVDEKRSPLTASEAEESEQVMVAV